MKKILIAIPCMDQVPAAFACSLAMLKKIYSCTLTMKIGSLVYTARNDITKMALEGDYDFVMWFDSDMVFPPETLERLMKTLEDNDYDMVTGLYFRRVPPYTPVLFDLLEFAGDVCKWSEFETIPDKPFEVGGCGFGCLLMKTDVFFDLVNDYSNMFTPVGSNGEDVAFCIRAREKGYKIYCDPSVVCGHVGYSVIDDKFFKAFSRKEE